MNLFLRSVVSLACFGRMVVAFSSMARTRTFRYVPYGESAPSDSLTITCDGRVPGSSLEVTHWTGTETPDLLYADTSTEMALKLAKNANEYQEFESATVLNNHYDTDGVCSVWACLEPELALKYEKILISAAEAGDFGEWNSDEGLKMDLILSEFCLSDEEQAYERALTEMPEILKDMDATGGEKYKKLWEAGYQDAISDWSDICEGRINLRRSANRMHLVIAEEATPTSRVSCYALHRGMKVKDLWSGTTRVLRVNHLANSNLNKYCYEKVGHGWVSKLVDRHIVPSVSETESLIVELNKAHKGNPWSAKGPSGLVAICQNQQGISAAADDVAALLSQLDEH